MNTSVSVIEKGSENEVVTRGILCEVLKSGVEKRIDSVGIKLEDMDKKLVFIYKRTDSFDEKLYTLTYEVREEYPRYIQSMFEEMREDINQRFEMVNVRFDAFEKRFDALEKRFEALESKIDSFISFFGRYIKSNEDDKMESNRRIGRLEAEVF
jgi:chaperonin cofactor prefoldin